MLEGPDWPLVFALRIAAMLLLSSAKLKLPPLRVSGDVAGFALELPQAWLDENPLWAEAMESETGYWKAVDSKFTLSALSEKRGALLARP